jgi:hypothetical protein
MEYYNVDTDCEPKITGKRNGDVAVEKNKNSFSSKAWEKKFNTFFRDNYDNIERVQFNNFQTVEYDDSFIICYFPLTKSVKRLDFMGFRPYEHGLQFLITRRVYDVISKYRLPVHNKIPAKIDTFDQEYILIGFPMLEPSTIDFNKSAFFAYDIGEEVTYTDANDWKNAEYSRLLATPQKIFLKNKLEYDIIETIKGTFISSEIIAAFKKENITGYKIQEGILVNE